MCRFEFTNFTWHIAAMHREKQKQLLQAHFHKHEHRSPINEEIVAMRCTQPGGKWDVSTSSQNIGKTQAKM